MGGPWPMKAAMDSRPSAVSLKVWLGETKPALAWLEEVGQTTVQLGLGALRM